MLRFVILIVLLQIMAAKSKLQDGLPTSVVENKQFVLGIFFKANWYRAAQFCRYHGMNLASIESQLEHDAVVNLITDLKLTNESFWISGNDLASPGDFFWMANGQPLTFTNWLDGEPNNIGTERCMEMWNIGVQLWNNRMCKDLIYFVCEKFL